MEDLSRRLLVALVVAAAGPAAAMLTLQLFGPTLVAASVPDSGTGLVEVTGSVLAGLLIGGLIASVLACFVAAAATLAALRATGCPHPSRAWLICLVLSPLWIGALSTFDLDAVGLVVLSGVLPGAVRLWFGDHEPPDSAASTEMAPPPVA